MKPKSHKGNSGRPQSRGRAGGPSSRPRRDTQKEHGHGRTAPRDTSRWVVGIHSCAEALRVRPREIREVWLKEGWESSESLRELEELARAQRIPTRFKSIGQLDALATGHQGVALAATVAPEVDWEKLRTAESALVVILDGIEDPHNLGSILRTCWLMGVDAILTPADRAVGLTPAACKVASGGAEHVPVEAVSNLASVMEDLKQSGFWIYGLAESGTKFPWQFELAKKTAWVVGAEAGGIRKPVERVCDEMVRLPQVSSGSSYNAAVACAMALTDTSRQRGFPGG